MDLPNENGLKPAYIKEVSVADLPSEIQEELSGVKTLFAVYDDSGTQLALVNDQRLAFSLARENDYQPYALN